MAKLILLYKLKPGVAKSDFETWVRDVDQPAMRGLKRVESFNTYAAQKLLMGEGEPSVDYVEIFDIPDLAGFTSEDMAGETVQSIMGQFMGFTDAPQFIICQDVDSNQMDLEALRDLSLSKLVPPFVSKASPESVFPGFTLGRFEDKITSNRLLANCLISDSMSGQPTWVGSGFALSPYHVLTAGHVADWARYNGRGITQGLNDFSNQSGRFVEIAAVDIHRAYETRGDASRDIAIITTESPLNYYDTVLQTYEATVREIGLEPRHLSAVGYPWMKRTHRNMGWGNGKFFAQRGNVFAHKVNTSIGMSGGMILTDKKRNGVASRIIGLQIEGFAGRAGGFGNRLNKGILFTDEIVSWISNRL